MKLSIPYKKTLSGLLILAYLYFHTSYGMNKNNDIVVTPNHHISTFESLPVETLIKIIAHINPNEKNRLSTTSISLYKFLKEYKDIIIETNPHTVHYDDCTKALFEGIQLNKYSLVKNLLTSGSIKIYELKNILGISPIYYALKNNNQKMTTLLKQYKANINQTAPHIHAIHEAAYHGNINQMKFLLTLKTNPNIPIKNRIMPLHIAVHENHAEIVQLLVHDKRTLIDTKNSTFHETPLHIAVEKRYNTIVEILISANADINATNIIKRTALHIASKRGDLNCMELLLNAGAEINAKDNAGNTPLHLASLFGYTDAVTLLINAGAKIRKRI